MRTEWNECTAHATYTDDNRRSVTVICDLPLHCAPTDASEMHWDDKLGIYWKYADGADLD